MKYQHVRLSESEGFAVLSLHRPPLNILNIAMMQEISQALAEVHAGKEARALLIRGEGKCFSAGMDVSDHLPDNVEDMLREMHFMFESLAALDIPTVCAVHGSAMGGGLELAVFADMTFAAAGSRLGVPEIQLGVFPPVAVACFADLVGPKLACEMVLTGRTFFAEEALSIGLVNAVYPAEDLEARVDDVMRILAGLSRPVLVAAKKALRSAAGKPMFQALRDAERIYMEEVMTTLDSVEGLRSFLEKRQPQWKNQ